MLYIENMSECVGHSFSPYVDRACVPLFFKDSPSLFVLSLDWEYFSSQISLYLGPE